VPDGGFEQPYVGSASVNDPLGTPWTFQSSAGVAGNGSPITHSNPPAPEGTQVAFLATNGSISQTISLAAGTYTLSFAAAHDGNFPGANEQFSVTVDGKTVGTYTPTSLSYSTYTTSAFTVSAGNHTIAFKGLGTSSSNAIALLDKVSVAPTTSTANHNTSILGAPTTTSSASASSGTSTTGQAGTTTLPGLTLLPSVSGFSITDQLFHLAETNPLLQELGLLLQSSTFNQFLSALAQQAATGPLSGLPQAEWLEQILSGRAT
jgi:hypothetical protein